MVIKSDIAYNGLLNNIQVIAVYLKLETLNKDY